MFIGIGVLYSENWFRLIFQIFLINFKYAYKNNDQEK